MPIVMGLGSCDFAYIRIHRRTGNHRVLSDGEIKRYGAEASDRLVIAIGFPVKNSSNVFLRILAGCHNLYLCSFFATLKFRRKLPF